MLDPKSVRNVLDDYNQVMRKDRKGDKAILAAIKSRLASGYTIDDFRVVHRWVAATWVDDPFWAKYASMPTTIYRQGKFGDYVMCAREWDKKQVAPRVEQTRKQPVSTSPRHWSTFTLPIVLHNYAWSMDTDQRLAFIAGLPESLRPFAERPSDDTEGFNQAYREEYRNLLEERSNEQI